MPIIANSDGISQLNDISMKNPISCLGRKKDPIGLLGLELIDRSGSLGNEQTARRDGS